MRQSISPEHDPACYGPGPSYPQHCYVDQPPAPLVVQRADIGPGTFEFSVLSGLGFFLIASLAFNLILRVKRR